MGTLKRYLSEFEDVIKNFSYTLTYQVLAIILPIITVPYVTRVLDQDLVGLNSVVQANAYYFELIGMLGITLLGPREIAKCLGDKRKLSDTFYSIYKIQFLMHLAVIFVYIGYVAVFSKGALAYFYVIYLISYMFDISWLFIGIEDFKNVAIRNVFVRLLSFALLFILVRNNDDIFTYVATLYVPSIIINIYMWFTAIRHIVGFQFIKGFNKGLFKESVSLLIPQVASSIYTVLDKTVLGIFSTYAMAAVYTQGQTLLRLMYAFAGSFCRVMSPRLSNCIARKDKDDVYKYMRMSTHVIGCITCALFFGLISCAKFFVAWYLPEGYEKTTDVLLICAPIIIMVSIANLISIEFLIPLGQQKKYTISVIASSVVNLILNFSLAPSFGIYGVCIGSVAAETVGAVIQIIYARKYLDFKILFKGTQLYVIAGIVMFLILRVMQTEMQPTFISIVVLVLTGIIIYFGIIALYMKIRKHGQKKISTK